MRKEFRSRDFVWRPANGIGAALMAAGAKVPMKREPKVMVIDAGTGARNVLSLKSN